VIDNNLMSGHQLVAPNSIRSEAMELLWIDVGRGRRSDQDALETHERMTELKLRLLGDRASRTTAWRLAREHNWDRLRAAEYLAIAKLQADALVTIDMELAGKAANVVPVVELAAVFKTASARSREAKGRSAKH
jgi:predicted nucleic acid-binding protein